jgi:hypothetical protein
MKHSTIFKKYINGIGFYSRIAMTVEEGSEPQLIIEIDDEFVDSEWQSAIRFAVNYFFDHLPFQEKKGKIIKIDDLHTMTGDSTNSVVFFVAVTCLCEMFNMAPLIVLDENTAFFSVAK